MSEALTLDAVTRTVTGKKVKALRASGMVPANLFGKGRESLSIQIEARAAQKAFDKAGKNHPIEISLDGKSKDLALIKEVSHDPVKGMIQHIAFHVVKKGEKVTAEIPVHLVGECPAERAGNIVVIVNDFVEVEADPMHLPESFEVDRSGLVEPEDALTVADIVVPKGVSMVTELEAQLARIEAPRSQIEATEVVGETPTPEPTKEG